MHSKVVSEILVGRASQNWDMQNFIIDLFEKYQHDPNSLFHDEERGWEDKTGIYIKNFNFYFINKK